jgi:serine/threonine protein kinase
MVQDSGRLLGNRYQLFDAIGRGGMGVVWRAKDVMLDREVAVKEVSFGPGLSRSERDILYQRTLREARASARLNHPNVVIVHDVVEQDSRPWIVMELVRAESLQDIIDREGTIAPWRAADIGRQVLEALRAAHRLGILHRDVKPSNILITAQNRVVLTDFGIAQMEGDVTLTQTGLVMGSPAYIPPERVQGERAVPASDLWSLGATLYAAVEGRAPYERPDAMAALSAALTEQVPPPRNAGQLTRVLEGLLVRQPALRMTGEQAAPLLRDVSASQPNPVPVAQATQFDETILDRKPPKADAPMDTILDSGRLEQASAAVPAAPRPQVDADARTLFEPGAWNQQPVAYNNQPSPYGHGQDAPKYGQPSRVYSPGDNTKKGNTRTNVIITLSVLLTIIALGLAVYLVTLFQQ